MPSSEPFLIGRLSMHAFGNIAIESYQAFGPKLNAKCVLFGTLNGKYFLPTFHDAKVGLWHCSKMGVHRPLKIPKGLLGIPKAFERWSNLAIKRFFFVDAGCPTKLNRSN